MALKNSITLAKKTFKATEADTKEKQLQPCQYWSVIKDVPAKNLGFLDETEVQLARSFGEVYLPGSLVNLAMVNLYARAVKGKRADSKRPLKRGKNIAIIGAMTLEKGFLTGLSSEARNQRKSCSLGR